MNCFAGESSTVTGTDGPLQITVITCMSSTVCFFIGIKSLVVSCLGTVPVSLPADPSD